MLVNSDKKKATVYVNEHKKEIDVDSETIRKIERTDRVSSISLKVLDDYYSRENYNCKSIELLPDENGDKRFMCIVYGSSDIPAEKVGSNLASPMYGFMLNKKADYMLSAFQDKFVYQIYKLIDLFNSHRYDTMLDNYLVNQSMLRLQEVFFEDGFDLFNM